MNFNDKILIVNNFLSSNECAELEMLFNISPFPKGQASGDWYNRVKWPNYPKNIFDKISTKRTELSSNFFNKKLRIDNLNMTLWNVNNEMLPHSDYGANNEFPQREYASLIYINDNYEGGELYIPDLNFELKPQKGQLITFQGGKYKHGVKKITSGYRITSICWFSEIINN